MRYSVLFAIVAAAAVEAQSPPPAKPSGSAKCVKTTEAKPPPDPLTLFTPGSATFPCDMGQPIPFGPVPKGCAKLEIIYARGTSEPGPLGMIAGDPLVARVKRDLKGVEARGYPVQYPASIMNSAPVGIADVQKRIEQQSKECPDEKFVLSGYSQGGLVVTSAANKLTADQAKKVIAIVLYGGGNGTAVKGELGERTLANCAPGDFACPQAGKGPGHVSYNNKGTVWHDRSAQYVVSAFNGKPLGKKTMRSETDPL